MNKHFCHDSYKDNNFTSSTDAYNFIRRSTFLTFVYTYTFLSDTTKEKKNSPVSYMKEANQKKIQPFTKNGKHVQCKKFQK